MGEKLTDYQIEKIINNDSWNNGVPDRNMDWLVRVYKLGSVSKNAEIERLKSEKENLRGADLMIKAIEKLYPDWGKFRDIAECVEVHIKMESTQ